MPGRSKNALPYNVSAVRAARFADGQERPIEGCPGLYLRIAPSEHAAFVFRYSANGTTLRQPIGHRDGPAAILLADARAKAAELVRGVRDGSNPAVAKQLQKGALTLRQLFEARELRDADLAGRTIKNHRAALERDVFALLGNTPADKVTADQCAALLMKIEDRSPNAAATARSAIGSTYRWAQKRRMVAVNPCSGLGFTYKSAPRNRLLSDSELKALWCAVSDPGSRQREQMRIVIKLMMLTGQREGEVAGARVDELRLGDVMPTWRIDATSQKMGKRVEGRMKAKTEQNVYLSRQVTALFERAIAINDGSNYVFPRFNLGQNKQRFPHVSPDSVSALVGDIFGRLGIQDAHAHDLRKNIATWLGEQGEPSAVIDRVLHHTRKGVTDTHYNFAQLRPQLQAAWQRWADHVESIVA